MFSMVLVAPGPDTVAASDSVASCERLGVTAAEAVHEAPSPDSASSSRPGPAPTPRPSSTD